MKIIIYNPNSKGGNYKYALHTAQELSNQETTVSLLLPFNTKNQELTSNNNTTLNHCTYKPFLISDQPNTAFNLFKKLHFFFRILLNPFIFFFYLIKQPASKVIFNDFDQLTAILWTPIFRLLKKKHQFAVVLHDPQRDAYPGGIKHSNRSMKSLMSIMDIAFFHEQLPEKIYYTAYKGKKVSIPHGIYPPAPADKVLTDKLKLFKKGASLLCIPGNIRMEKNYELIINTLAELPKYKLLIAGAPSSSSVKVENLKSLANQQQISHRIYWCTKYLTNEEFTSILEVSDLVLLYYKTTFTSQSGILNQIAPLKKNVLISDTPSALAKLAKEFNLGTLAKADDKNAFIKGVETALYDNSYIQHWNEYLKYASWKVQGKLIIDEFRKLV